MVLHHTLDWHSAEMITENSGCFCQVRELRIKPTWRTLTLM